MNCSFIAYPAVPEHKNVLVVYREPIGRKTGEGNADLCGTEKKKNNSKQTLLNKMEITGCLKCFGFVMRKG